MARAFESASAVGSAGSARILGALPGVIMAALAAATFAAVFMRAVGTVDPYWDTLAYHWPYAARIAGLCDRECFSMVWGMEQRYEGFPLLLHAAQGLLWRITGTPGLADLINIACVGLLVWYLRVRFSVPLSWTWLALIAIPQVQTQLTSSYIDLPVNALVTVALLVLLRMLVQPESTDHRPDSVLALLALTIAVGSKYQMVPVAFVTWLAISIAVYRRPAMVGAVDGRRAALVLGIVAAPLLLWKLGLNALHFGNPFYPVKMSFGPIHLPGTEAPLSSVSVSDYWASYPAPVRWLASIMEFDAYRGRPSAWTLGQGDVPSTSPGFRMGGYFVPYVLGSLLLLWWSVKASGRARVALFMVAALSLMCALVAASHELRYYMFWMLFLVCALLAVVHSRSFASDVQSSQRTSTRAMVGIAAVSVITMSGGDYLRVQGPTLDSLLARTEQVVSKVPEGGTLCIAKSHQTAFLYASVFHPNRHYRTRAIFSDSEPGCTLTVDPDHTRP